jgi:hypothetical protein
VEKVEEVMEDINEQIAMGEEIGEAMSNPIGAPMDEEDLSKELEEMEGMFICCVACFHCSGLNALFFV